MKILRIVYDWPPPWYGLAPAPYEMTVAQTKLGHTVDVFCGRWPRAGAIEQPENVLLRTFVREPFAGTVTLTTSVLMFLYYLKWRRDNTPDVIHAHGHFGIWIFLYRLILRKFFSRWSKEIKIPMVVHFHNTVQGRWDSLNEQGMDIKPVSRYLAYPMEKFANNLAVQTADALIFVSEDNKNEAIKFYKAEPSKCYVVETGVNTKLFSPVGNEEKEKSRRELDLDLYDKVILNNGSMVERKNIHLLVEAMQFLPNNYKLLLVGPGDPEYLLKIDDIIQKNNLKNRVVKAGYTPYPQVSIAFQVSDIFVLPSSFEGLPKVVIQSLACGVPALVSGFKLSEQVEGLYYLDNLDPQNIAQSIKNIIENPKPVNIAKILHFYTWDEKAKQVEKVYEIVKNK